jgi:glutamate dehydrogenase/leucine dehydrogenase
MATVAQLTELQTVTLAAITALTTGGAKAYAINGRSVSKNDLRELREQYIWATNEIAALQSASRGNSSLVSWGKP